MKEHNYVSKYFKSNNDKIQQNFMGADGRGWSGANGWGGNMPANFAGQGMYNADSADTTAGVAQGNQSMPYILIVTNTTTATVSNIEVLNANLRQSNFAQTGISFSNGFGNMTYQQVLATIASGQAAQIGAFRLVYSNSTGSTANAQSNVNAVTTVSTYSMNGATVTMPFSPILNDNQFQTTQVTLYYSFAMTGLVSFNLAYLLGSNAVSIYFLPQSAVNQYQALQNQGSINTYAPPTNLPAFNK